MSMIFQAKEEHEKFLLMAFAELSKTEHKGIRNVMVLAFTDEGVPITFIDNAADTTAMACMLAHAQTHMYARNILQDKQYYDELYTDAKPDMVSDDWDDDDDGGFGFED